MEMRRGEGQRRGGVCEVTGRRKGQEKRGEEWIRGRRWDRAYHPLGWSSRIA